MIDKGRGTRNISREMKVTLYSLPILEEQT